MPTCTIALPHPHLKTHCLPTLSLLIPRFLAQHQCCGRPRTPSGGRVTRLTSCLLFLIPFFFFSSLFFRPLLFSPRFALKFSNKPSPTSSPLFAASPATASSAFHPFVPAAPGAAAGATAATTGAPTFGFQPKRRGKQPAFQINTSAFSTPAPPPEEVVGVSSAQFRYKGEVLSGSAPLQVEGHLVLTSLDAIVKVVSSLRHDGLFLVGSRTSMQTPRKLAGPPARLGHPALLLARSGCALSRALIVCVWLLMLTWCGFMMHVLQRIDDANTRVHGAEGYTGRCTRSR